MRVVAVMVAMAMLIAIGAAAAGPASVAVSRELFDAAAARGAVRVVVQLKVPEGTDAAAIQAVERALWSDLAGTTYRVVRDLPGLPAVVLDASAETLGALAISRHVSHVSEDRVRRPQQ
jgi:hypothetical protein